MKKFNHVDVQTMLDELHLKSIPMHIVENITIEYHDDTVKTVSRDHIHHHLPTIYETMLLNIEKLDVTPNIKNIIIKLDTPWLASQLNFIFDSLAVKFKTKKDP